MNLPDRLAEKLISRGIFRSADEVQEVQEPVKKVKKVKKTKK